MTMQEYLKKLRQNPVCRSMLPVDLAMLYPAFSIKRGTLCAHILCHRAAVRPEGLELWAPELYMEFTCPVPRPVTIINFKYDGPWTEETMILPNRTPEAKAARSLAIRSLLSLGDTLLEEWEKTGEADVTPYNICLSGVLEPSQWELLAKTARLNG